MYLRRFISKVRWFKDVYACIANTFISGIGQLALVSPSVTFLITRENPLL